MQPPVLPIEDLFFQFNEESGVLVQSTAKYLLKQRGNKPTPLSDNDCLKPVLKETWTFSLH